MTNSPEESHFAGDPSRLSHWLDAAREGSDEALEQIVNGCRGYLLEIANRELDSDLHRKISASDLVQNSFINAQQSIGTFRGQSEKELLGWLREILLNNLRNTRRAYRQTDKRQIGREVSLGDASNGGVVDVASDTNTPGAKNIAKEEARLLAQAMDTLPEDYQQAVKLRNWERLTFAEVGERMDRSEDAARKLWSRAIEQLQQELDRLNGSPSV